MADNLIHEFRGQKFWFEPTRDAPGLIAEIFGDNYKVLQRGVEFREGDVVLDVGANEGMFSIMLAKLFPQTRVIALEPVPRTFWTLVRNIGLNGCGNVEARNVGIGKSGQKTAILNVSKDYSGGSTAWCTHNPEHHDRVEVELLSLDEAFSLYGIDRCRLLKCDIEGMEYEALYGSTVLPRVDYFTGEFHSNRRLDFESRRMDGLVTWVANQTQFIHVDLCHMAE